MRADLLLGDTALAVDVAGGATIGQVLRDLGYPSSSFLARVEGQFLPADTPMPEGVAVEILLVRDEPSGSFGSGKVTGAGPRPTGSGGEEPRESPGGAAKIRVPSCDFCGRPAVTCDRFAASATAVMRVYRCRECFLSEMERRALGVCQWHDLVRPGDHVLVPLSGGKDSAAELFFLNRFARRTGGIRLTAYTLRMGRHRTFALAASQAAKLAASLGVPHVAADFEASYGTTLEEVVTDHLEAARRFAPCAVCAATRRQVERDLVTRLGVTTVSTGETRTDQERHLLWGIFQHTRWRQVTLPRREDPVEGVVHVSPLFGLSDRETALLVRLLDLPALFHQDGECPFSRLALRGRQAEIVERMEDVYPGLLLETRRRVLRYLRAGETPAQTSRAATETVAARHCPTCGEALPPQSQECALCRVLRAFGLSLPRPPGEGYPLIDSLKAVGPNPGPNARARAAYLLHPEVRWVGRRPGGWLIFTPGGEVLEVSDRESKALLDGGVQDRAALSRFLKMGLVRAMDDEPTVREARDGRQD